METRRDPTLSKVMDMTINGWSQDVSEEFAPYTKLRNELSILQGCLMWGNRVIVPPKLRPIILAELHEAHLSIVKMKAIARSFVWWPKLDKAIEETAKDCRNCQQIQHAPPLTVLHPWIWPSKPWQHIHVDFAGPFSK